MKTLCVLAADEHLELDTEREVGREGIVDDGVDDHDRTMTRSNSSDKKMEGEAGEFPLHR